VPVNSPKLDYARAATSLWDLAMAPAYFMTTLYQPMQIALPFIGGRFGHVDTARALARNGAKAYGILNRLISSGWATDKADMFTKLANVSDITVEFAKLKNKDGSQLLSPQELDVLDHLQWTGLLNFGQTNQLARVDPSDHSIFAKTARMMSVFPHYIEVGNRLTTMLTAYEMATTKGGQSHGDGKNLALQAVRDYDGDHSQANIARRLGKRGIAGPLTPLLVGFNQYTFQMLGLMARTMVKGWGTDAEAKIAQKQLAGVAVMTGMVAGTLGLPFVTAATAAANAIMGALGDENADPPDVQHSWRMLTDHIFGQKGGEIVSHGLPRAFDFDMSGRLGFQDILPFSKFLADRRKFDDKIKDGMLGVAGPTVGMLSGFGKAKEAMHEGDYVTAINNGLPAALRNPAKAYRLSEYGYEATGSGNQIPIGMPTGWNTFMQGLGFTSSARSEQAESTFQFNTNQRLLQAHNQAINNRIYRAVEHGDYKDLAAAFQANIDFMIKHPQFRASFVGGLRERAVNRAVGEASGTGILTGRRQFPLLQDYQ
jgi:hypothetical protein